MQGITAKSLLNSAKYPIKPGLWVYKCYFMPKKLASFGLNITTKCRIWLPFVPIGNTVPEIVYVVLVCYFLRSWNLIVTI